MSEADPGSGRASEGALGPLQRAYVKIVELQARLDAAERERREPVAVIGMACRFPGATGLQAYWRLLSEGRNAIREIPSDRWDVEGLYSADPQAPGKMYTRWGGFLDGVDGFDTQFFSITPREAVNMDPQQRLLLEVAWEALEQAGLSPDELRGSRSGVFIGTGFTDYGRLVAQLDPSHVNAYSGSGLQSCFCAGRISYVLDLRGPSMPVDTACSSSLVAVHQACRSLRAGECDLALAGGVNLLLAPEGNIFLSKAGALSPDGQCRTFDESANGFVRGEGCGVVVLKRLSDALAAGDNVLALLTGSAVNHDGHSSGLTVPNGPAQEAVLSQALRSAGIEPQDVSYVEAHGTGTPLGDPIEMQSLVSVFCRARPRRRPLLVASVKTNFGHLEAAAGVAALIKVVLMMRAGEVPPHLHFKRLNPHIRIEPGQIDIPTRLVPWPREGTAPRVAGVSGFGLSGTNAHLVVQEPAAPAREPRVMASGSRSWTLVLSARKPEALHELALAYRDYLTGSGREASAELGDVAFTAATGRSHHDHRLAVTSSSAAEAALSLDAFARGESRPEVLSGRRPLAGTPRLAFVFGGQGSQRVGMGGDLIDQEPVFRSLVERCDALFGDLGQASLLDVLRREDEGLLQQTRFAQPAIFALQVALAALWRRWGIEPDLVIGHSLGEVAAAHVAGALELEEAVRLVKHRARLMQRLTGKGRMAAAGLSADAARSFLSELGEPLSIAAVNAPRSVVLSGEPGALARAMARLAERRILCRDLGVDYAFHSDQSAALDGELSGTLGQLRLQAPRIPVVSTVTGRTAGAAELDAGYWGRNVSHPVLFAQAMDEAIAEGARLFLEIGPRPVLAGAVAQCLGHRRVEGAVVPSLDGQGSDSAALQRSVARLYTLGCSVRWRHVFPEGSPRLSDLPTYPWQHQSYWLEVPRASPPAPPGEDVRSWLYELRWAAKPLPEASRGEPRAWLILEDDAGVGRQLALALRATGQTARCMSRAELGLDAASMKDGLDRGVLRDALRSRLDELDGDAGTGIVHLWTLDSTPAPKTTAESLIDDQGLSVASALQVIQHLASRPGGSSRRLWLVTRGAQAPVPGREALELSQAPIWGLGRTCAAEFPALWGGLVDVDPGASAREAAEQVLAAVLSTDREDQAAFRSGTRYVARVVRAAPPAPRPVAIDADAAYLVTGGRSGVGLEVAGWLARKGARTLVLMARTPPPPPEEWSELPPSHGQAPLVAALRRLQEAGVAVHTPAVDVSDEAQLRAFVDDYRARGLPRIRGVFHAASVWKDGRGRGLVLPIAQMDVGSIGEVFPPKMVGAWLLSRLLGESLDFLVLFSTAASIVGSMGQGNYSAANSFLDALAHDLSRRGGPRALAVNWGPITDVGFGVTPEGRALFGLWERRGISGISPQQVLEALELLLPQDAVQAGLMRTDWRRLRQTYAELLSAPWASELDGSGPEEPRVDLPRMLQQASAGERKAMLVGHLQEQLRLVMGFRPEETPDPQQGLFAMGLDSLLSLELKNRIEATVQRSFPATAVFDHPSLDALADYLLADVLALRPLEAVDRDDEDAGLLAGIEELSEDEVRARLERKVAGGP